MVILSIPRPVIGVTVFPDGEDTIEDLLRQGDNAMYLCQETWSQSSVLLRSKPAAGGRQLVGHGTGLTANPEAKQFQLLLPAPD